MRRGELSAGDDIECLTPMTDWDTKDGCIYEQHDNLYTQWRASMRSFRRFSAVFVFFDFVIRLYFNV